MAMAPTASAPTKFDNGNCHYESLPGTEIVFAALSPELQHGGYQNVFVEPSATGSTLGYKQLVGRQAKVLPPDGNTTVGKYFVWRRLVTDTCQILYFEWTPASNDIDSYASAEPSSFPTLSSQASSFYYYLLSDYVAALRLVGHAIWINSVAMSSDANPGQSSSWIEDSLTNTQEVTVVKVLTENMGLVGERAIKLFVKTGTGREGLVNYDFGFFYTRNPIRRSWPTDIVHAIRNRSVVVGMTKEQAELAWGNPESVNVTSGASYEVEQWVYRNYNYLYFKNGTLTNIQSSGATEE